MNKTLLSAALIAGFGIAAFAPQTARAAADGTITITGQVVAQTCTVDTNAFGTPDLKTVALPLVLAPALSTVGNVAGLTAFNIVLAGCDSSLTSAQTFFSGGNIDATTGNLSNPAGATGVEVQLLDNNTASPTVMLLNQGTPTAQKSSVVNLAASGGTKGATLKYSAQYVATGPVTAGAVSSTVQFTMVYL